MDIKTKSFKFKANFVITIKKQNKQKTPTTTTETSNQEGKSQPLQRDSIREEEPPLFFSFLFSSNSLVLNLPIN